MADAEAHNAAGNEAFKAGNFARATEEYFKAVQANGTVAKFRTNLCNALLKEGSIALAIEEAAAAIAVDSSWPKGYYYKARALEELGEFPRALSACEEGLHVHRHNTALQELRSTLQQRVEQQEQEQEQLRQGLRMMRTVTYRALVRDASGHEQGFEFRHQIDSDRIARAATDQVEATSIIKEVAMPHYHEMLKAQPWLCVSCQMQHGRLRPATKLFLHAMSYLSQTEPLIQDMGPTPACDFQECATYTTQMAQQLKAEANAYAKELGKPPFKN